MTLQGRAPSGRELRHRLLPALHATPIVPGTFTYYYEQVSHGVGSPVAETVARLRARAYPVVSEMAAR